MTTYSMLVDVDEVEVRRHNGQCAYGPWMPLVGSGVEEEVADEIVECHCRDMRREEGNGNTPQRGRIVRGGAIWLYRVAE